MARKKSSTNADVLERKETTNFLLIIAFIEGGMVMATELLSAKMVTPYFGTTVPVWSSVLGVTMLGLSLGYFIGGKLSSQPKNNQLLYFLIVAAAVLTSLLPISGPLVMNQLLGFEDFRLAALVASLGFILPTMIFYGTIPPLIIEKVSESVEDSGNKTGYIYAVSTTGGIIMTLITGFYLLPDLGIRYTSVIVGSVFGCCAFIYFVISKQELTAVFIALGLFLVSFANISQLKDKPINSDFIEVYSTNTLHGNMKVIDYKSKETRALFNNNISQTYMHVPTRRSQWTYVHRLATYTSFLPKETEVFLVGLGGGNLVTEFNNLGFLVDVCDIEPRTVKMAREYFGMTEPRTITIDDARHHINSCKKTYDLIVLDVSAGEIQPGNLYTIEGFTSLKKMLNPAGIIFIHYPTVMGGEEVLALQSIMQTMDVAGFNVELINTGDYPDIIREQFIVASVHDFDLEQQDFSRRDPFSIPFDFQITGNFMLDGYDYSKGYVLTDDRPIMDELHYGISKRHRKDGIQVTVKGMLKSGMKMF